MACDSETTTVSNLKVDFGCTRNCPTDVKNMLEQLKGVKSISIDPNQGKVTVVGNVNPTMLIKLLQRMGKKAQLCSFDKAPLQKNAGSHRKPKKTSHCCESSDSEDDPDTDFHESCSSCRHTQHTPRHDRTSKKRNSQKNQFDSTDKHAAAPATSGYHPQMPGYQPYTGYNFPLQYHPSAYARPVPWYGSYWRRVQPMSSRFWPPHYDSRLQQQNDPMIHYTSYADNYHYTQ